jgi:hypothetical protein
MQIPRLFAGVLTFTLLLGGCASRPSSREGTSMAAAQPSSASSSSNPRAACPVTEPSLSVFDAFDGASAATRVPADFGAALSELDRVLTEQQRQALFCIRRYPAGALHGTLARWLRNEWGLYAGSPLARDMIARGFIHPDDMSNAIVRSYVRRIRGEEIRLEQQAELYRRFWKSQGVDVTAEQRRLGQ